MSDWITKLKAVQPETLQAIVNSFSNVIDEIRPSSLTAYQHAEDPMRSKLKLFALLCFYIRLIFGQTISG